LGFVKSQGKVGKTHGYWKISLDELHYLDQTGVLLALLTFLSVIMNLILGAADILMAII